MELRYYSIFNFAINCHWTYYTRYTLCLYLQVTHLSCETSSNSNLDISYSIDGPSSHLFHIDPSSGSVSTLSYLDYETQHNYQLTLSCSCCSSPQLISYTALFISLSDVNEFPPVFSPPEHTLSLSEHTQPGTDILHLHTTDMDTGSYGQVRYRLLNHLETFYLHSDTGNMTILTFLYLSAVPFFKN